MGIKFAAGGYAQKVYPPWPDPLSGQDCRAAEWFEALRVEPGACWEWVLEPFFLHAARITPDVNWMYLPDAYGEVLVGPDEVSCKVSPGDHIFLPSGVRHVERFPMRRQWHMFSLHFTANLWGGLDFLAASGFPLHITGNSEGDPLAEIAVRLCREHAMQSPGWQVAIRSGIEQALIHVIRCHGSCFSSIDSAACLREQMRLLPVFECIASRLADRRLSIGDLAGLLHVSEARFRQLFQKATGMRPVQFIQRKRIDNACRLLRQSDMPVKEVALACGFPELTFFHRTFRRRMGTSPAAFRRSTGL